MNQKPILSLFTLFIVSSTLSFATLEFGYIPSKTEVLPNETLTIQMVNLKAGLTNVLVGAITISGPVGDVVPGTVNAAFSFPFNGDKRDGTSDIWITNVSGSLFGGGTLGVDEILYTFTVTVAGSSISVTASTVSIRIKRLSLLVAFILCFSFHETNC